MSDTSNPNVVTKQSLTAATKTTDKQKDLQQYILDPSKYPDPTTSSPMMTTNFGVKIGDDDNSLKAGPRGPVLLEDVHFREKMNHFDHERIPERVVHARGAAAHGFFQVYDDSLKPYTTAGVLTEPGRVTSTFVRFSTVLGSRGSADTVRDVRGFATRFYTPEGNWDIVGNNIPVFFIQDALKFPDLIHAGKPEPHNEIPQGQTAHDNFWDFISLMPESSHMVMWILSDRTIPRSYRMMQGFGVNTFILVNAKRQRTFVKFHWRPVLGVHSLTWDECLKINGTDPDFHRRDLWEAIDNGAFPEYEFGVQLVPEADEDKFDFDLLDCTKLIPEEVVPVKWVGKMVLNKNVDEYFTETEQVAYCTQHLVPGIDHSDDPMLQGRNFSYQDTQLTRLGGPNFQQIPINRPICPVMNFQRDGWNQRVLNPGKINYWPNRQQFPKPGNATTHTDKNGITHDDVMNPASDEEKEQAALRANTYVSFHEKIAAMKVRARGPKFQEHFNQAELFFNSMSDVEKTHLTNAAIFELGHVDDVGVRQRMLDRLNFINHQLAVSVAKVIGLPAPKASARKSHGKTSPALSQLNTAFATIKSRKIAILAADGYDQSQMAALYAAIKAQSAIPMVVSTRKGPIYSSNHPGAKGVPPTESKEDETMDCSVINATWSIFTSRSILFDATIIVDGEQSVNTLSQYGEATGWVAETFKHYKAILAIGAGIQLLQAANLDRLSNVELASEKTGNKGVLSHGVVTVQHWSATPPPSGSGDEKEQKESTAGSIIQSVTTAVSAAIGAATGAQMSNYMPNDAASQFFDSMKKHRDWTRDVTKVPA